MTLRAVVLAGKRDGRLDPLAAQAGVSLKCLVPVAGQPLIVHVVRALDACAAIGEIVIVGDRGPISDALHGTRPTKPLRYVVPAAGLFDSIMAGADDASGPVLVTTADNVLLSPAALEQFVRGAAGLADGCALAMVRKQSVLAAHPDGQRRFYRFGPDEFSNCNLYWIGGPKGLRGAEVFRSGGQFVKFPLRIVRAFGLLNLVRFKLGMGSARGFFEDLSRRFGFPVGMVELSDGAVAIDVDNARSHAIAEELLLRRRA